MHRCLRINKIKTKLMRVNTKKEDSVFLAQETIEDVEYSTYLGSNISKDGGANRDIQTRIGMAIAAFYMLRPIWPTRVISRNTKLQIFNSNVTSVLLYGSETWRTTKANSNRLQSFVNRCLRLIMGIHWPEIIRNKELWERAGKERLDLQIRN